MNQPRQLENYQTFIPLDKQKLFMWNLFNNPQCKFLWYCGGFGSLDKNSKVWCKINNKIQLKTIGELYRRRLSVRVLAWTGKSFVWQTATPPVCEGHGMMFQVKTRSGKSVVVNFRHRFLTPEGYQELCALSVGDQLLSLACGPDEACEEVPDGLDDVVLVREQPSYRGGYLKCRRQRDGLAHHTIIFFQSFFRLFVDIYNFCCDIFCFFCSFHQRKNNSVSLLPAKIRRIAGLSLSVCKALFSFGHFFRQFRESWQVQLKCEYLPVKQLSEIADRSIGSLPFPSQAYVLQEPATPFAGSIGVPAQFPFVFSPLGTFRKFWDRVSSSFSFGKIKNNNSILPQADRITSIEPAGYRDYYDLHVPRYNNFVANGLIHHNSGKSYIGSQAAIRMGLYARGGRGLIARQTAVDLKATTMKTFFEVVDPSLIYSHNKSNQLITLVNGHEIYYWGLDDIERLKSLEIGWFWIDEVNEVAEDTFNVLKGRLRHKAQPFRKGFITSNSEGKNWTYRQFIQGKGIRTEQELQKYYVIKAPSNENTYLPEDYLDVLNSYTGDLYQRYVLASFDVFEGQIYPEISTGVHFIPDFAIPDDWKRIRGIDHGERNPTACLWCAVSPQNQLYVYREYNQSNKFVKYNVGKITALSKNEKYEKNVIDPSVKSIRGATGRKVDQEYREEFKKYESDFRLSFAQNDVAAGIARVHRYLNVDPGIKHPITKKPGSPRLFIFNSCTNLRDELESYKWKTPSSTSENDPEEKPRKKDDHLTDCLRYIVMSRPDIQLGYVHGSNHQLLEQLHEDKRKQLLTTNEKYLDNLRKQFPNSFRELK